MEEKNKYRIKFVDGSTVSITEKEFEAIFRALKALSNINGTNPIIYLTKEGENLPYVIINWKHVINILPLASFSSPPTLD